MGRGLGREILFIHYLRNVTSILAAKRGFDTVGKKTPNCSISIISALRIKILTAMFPKATRMGFASGSASCKSNETASATFRLCQANAHS